MFTSKAPDAEYKRLTEGDDSDAGEAVQSQTNKRLSLLEESFRRFSVIHASILLLEVVLCALLIAGFIVLNQTRRAVGSKVSLDGLSQLGSYNTSMKFQDGSKHMADSHDADKYWRDLLDSGGVISLNTEWARKQGLRPSAQSPTDPSQSIYQVDVFHALHCLVCLYFLQSSLMYSDLTWYHRTQYAKTSCQRHLLRGTRRICFTALTTFAPNYFAIQT